MRQVNVVSDAVLDKSYCIVYLVGNLIACSYISLRTSDEESFCQVNFFAQSCKLLLTLICRHVKISRSISLSHAFYIGKEVYKAELCKLLSQPYIQS